ncbi:SAM-dependent methyltransferase [Devosia rhizoryzae]|uniref:Methyltransferase domain-containing protein n=1 Tax=Devosia rhizoryzae TaxID=2774137 RepID=A0ABX7C626_9HYPH|nr:class I SAM-dependent methyltransferase [Devosia rhizoryzae]QQR39182.1 methyltransferase domain-containing protein [Devosia rhizoryzae]
MTQAASSRIAEYVAALPLRPDMAVLEIGCGPGVAARLVCRLLEQGHILAIDRSAKAIEQARAGSAAELKTGRIAFRQVAIEDFVLDPNDGLFDLAFAMRVGALDGRHPELQELAMRRIKVALKPDGLLFIDDAPAVRGKDIAAQS